MDTAQAKIAGTGLLFVMILLSGLGMSHSGRPLNFIVFNIHKFAGLAALVLLVVTAYRTNQAASLSTIELIACVITVLLFVATIITGGLVSLDKPMPKIVLTLHQILPFVTMLSNSGALFLLLSRKP